MEVMLYGVPKSIDRTWRDCFWSDQPLTIGLCGGLLLSAAKTRTAYWPTVLVKS